MYGMVIFLFLCMGALAQESHKCKSHGYQIVAGRFGEESHLLCIKTQLIGSLTSSESALLLDPDAEIDGNSIEALAGVAMAHGFPVEDPSAGSAEGYIGDDEQFYGVLHFRGRTLHADPYGKDQFPKSFGAFENDNLSAPRFRRRSQMDGPVYPFFQYIIEERKFIPGVARSKLCDLLLLADKEFFEKEANSSISNAVKRMVHAAAQADVVFRNADFDEDGAPDNIGFTIKYVLVLTSNETNTRVFGDLLKDQLVDGRNYLMRFARLRRLSEVCLGVAFSGHAFHNRTLGLSFTSLGGGMSGAAGGLCDRRAFGRSFNTLALAHATNEDDERVPERVAAITLTHELGHSFGAHHDDNFPNKECQGYLMGSRSSVSDDGKHYEFSLCSKRLIASTLSSLSYCLHEEDRPYCGNGIVEVGEACDCGLPFHCSSRDPCCTPRAGGAFVYDDGTIHKEGCTVAPSKECHPSQGLCCTASCHFADLSSSGINCSSQDLQCTCPEMSSDCRCGLGGRCLMDGSCHAAECAKLGLRECQCSKPMKGAFAVSQMCGVCCQYKGICVDAEWVVRSIMKVTTLGEDYPDVDYHGPNVTITECNELDCQHVLMRGWKVGTHCVTLNQVGICSSFRICKKANFSPQSNVFPRVLNSKLMSINSGTSDRVKIVFNVISFTVILLKIYYK